MKILFFTNYSILGATSRYRIYNYINLYEESGIKVKTKRFWGDLYIKKIGTEKNKVLKMILLSFYYPFCIAKRLFSIPSALFYDIIHIERDFCPGIPPFGEYIITKFFKKKLTYEFDDSVFLSNRPKGKTEKVIKLSSGVIAGNEILAEYASKYCSKIVVIPTSIDLDTYNMHKTEREKPNEIITIGWIGSFSTIKYLDLVKDALGELAKVYKIQLNVICNREIKWSNSLIINNIKWKLDTYIEELCKFDIGIMPLYNNLWEQGKCGFKLIQYMGVGIPIVASPVGINKELVHEGRNGYLANNFQEWYDSLEKLITNKELRYEMGEQGSVIVEEHYTVKAKAPILIRFFNEINAEDLIKKDMY